MKITGLRTEAVRIPFETPIRTAIHHVEAVCCVLLRVDTDEGIEGQGLVWCMNAARLPVLDAVIHSLRPRVVGCDPHEHAALWSEMWADVNFFGAKGISLFGIAAIDMALWDLVGKAHDMSVCHLLGQSRDRVRAYHSGGLWVSLTPDELQAQAKDYLSQGYRAMKMRLGKSSVTEDIERVAAVREAIGPDIDLMADANQGFSVNHAIRMGRALEPYNLVWYEEPVQAHDLAGSARVAAEIDTPIASGETEYARYGFRDMIERGSADVLMPDLERVGGITEFVKVAHMADAFDIPVSPHVYTEQSLQLCGALNNIEYSEMMPWFAPLYNEATELEDGDLLIPDRPGLGFTFNADAIARYHVPS
ncbi:MAG: mandelate racemase/muconate lactonizing enzyme family protein [Alphaproteobacteria bacterium]|jgi:L-alanine-DL-glutamate epimerase-like enolase superfamily enzyme|nr:mandelate racemase [Rhodospirillaceae bacterium]MDP6021530.1 mandelate racemase/muconate lactonizing enzyme family protein [Alphaproteobacteria bacterium]MDP6256520.1 mandelate racemase/muconate lactonizing enzyme family protein [Alphaproteobacteria bacterium]MDP7056367.1 mandelate racemase/muconate lactonizing enzyme family protein [Alphaproteobacteria bacterium]MDP7228403.1 mandelate racemase/muconate lactonizing enzyme family protein [Alphaproteobacteria bacterium]|tara:strand:+ start:5499 stop:6587 length:1089 start_codon:yes stop_codon:yes gene_type:complete